jgi:Nucleotidyl transferase AbiEii toxin, Type IV TA system
MVNFKRPEHRAVAAALQAMDHDLLVACKCWFGGGTEIVLDLGEYRLSKDIDFLCADADGYRELRSLATSIGASALFGGDVREERAFRTDQYGIRGIISVHGVALRFEIVREGRIGLEGRSDLALGVPRLLAADRIAEKLLANADRCQDRSTAYRDAADLGMLALHRGPFPEASLSKAERAYGDDVGRKLARVLERLSHAGERAHVSAALGMDPLLLDAAARALLGEVRCLRIGACPADAVQVPPHPRQTHMVDASSDGRLVSIRQRPSVGEVPGKLDNTDGPAVVSRNREVYYLDGLRLPSAQKWREALSLRAAKPEAIAQ